MVLQERRVKEDTIAKKEQKNRHRVLLELTIHSKELPPKIAVYRVQLTQSVLKKVVHFTQLWNAQQDSIVTLMTLLILMVNTHVR
jgi:hypothetical protein